MSESAYPFELDPELLELSTIAREAAYATPLGADRFLYAASAVRDKILTPAPGTRKIGAMRLLSLSETLHPVVERKLRDSTVEQVTRETLDQVGKKTMVRMVVTVYRKDVSEVMADAIGVDYLGDLAKVEIRASSLILRIEE